SVLTDSAGRFQFRVGPGIYELNNQHAARADQPVPRSRLTIDDEPEVTVELHAVGLETSVLAGTAVEADGAPVKDATIQAFEDSEPRPSKISSDADGKFRIERKAVPLWLIGSSADHALGGRVRVEAEQDSATLTLAPAVTVVGRLFEDQA